MTGPELAERYGERVVRALPDLVEHCEAIERLVARGKSAYLSDEMLRYAAEDLLIRAGESVGRIDNAQTGFVEDHGRLELRNLKDSRNFVAHGYDLVDPETIWVIMEKHIPRALAGVRELLEG